MTMILKFLELTNAATFMQVKSTSNNEFAQIYTTTNEHLKGAY